MKRRGLKSKVTSAIPVMLCPPEERPRHAVLTKAERQARWGKLATYIRRAPTLDGAIALAKKDNVRAPTSAWLSALGKILTGEGMTPIPPATWPVNTCTCCMWTTLRNVTRCPMCGGPVVRSVA